MVISSYKEKKTISLLRDYSLVITKKTRYYDIIILYYEKKDLSS